MSVPPEIFVSVLAVSGVPTLGVLALDCRCRNGHWPDPRRGPWREAVGLVTSRVRHGARDLTAEDAPLVRLGEFVLSLGLLIRAGIWSLAFAVGGEGHRDVRHGFDREPIHGARADTRVGIAVFELALVGVMSQWAGGLAVAWPPGLETAVTALWAAQALPLLADTPLTAWALWTNSTDARGSPHGSRPTQED